MNSIIKKYLLACIGLGLMVPALSQKILTFEVEPPKGETGLITPVSLDLDGITWLSDSTFSVVEVQGTRRTPVPFQVVQDGRRLLYMQVKPGSTDVKKRVYELVSGALKSFERIEATVDAEALTMHVGNKNLLSYRHKVVYPPAGVDSAYKRSGFIHPLWSPHGQELTRIQPKDHYHHYGIWNPWTHVLYKGDTIDFWNLNGKKGTVRFAKFISTTSGPVFSESEILHEHVVLKLKKQPVNEVALNEFQTIRVFRPEPNQDYFYVDLTFQLNCASDIPFNILEYRYAGMGWRGAAQWDRNNSEFLSSEGKTRKDADGTKARWYIMQGMIDGENAGAIVMSHPSNYNHPEPLRVWPENQYDRGDVFTMFAPTKDTDWKLMPGKKYILKYRMVVFNGRMTKEKAETAWQSYVAPPKITIKKN